MNIKIEREKKIKDIELTIRLTKDPRTCTWEKAEGRGDRVSERKTKG